MEVWWLLGDAALSGRAQAQEFEPYYQLYRRRLRQ